MWLDSSWGDSPGEDVRVWFLEFAASPDLVSPVAERPVVFVCPLSEIEWSFDQVRSRRSRHARDFPSVDHERIVEPEVIEERDDLLPGCRVEASASSPTVRVSEADVVADVVCDIPFQEPLQLRECRRDIHVIACAEEDGGFALRGHLHRDGIGMGLRCKGDLLELPCERG